MGDSSPKSKNKQQHQHDAKKKSDAKNAAAKQAPPATTAFPKKGGK